MQINRGSGGRSRTRMGRRRPTVVVCEDAVRWAFEIVELPARNRPPERSADQEREHDRERDQQVEDFHCVPGDPAVMCSGTLGGRALPAGAMRASRHALTTTMIDDADMPSAAASGERCPVAARGFEIAL